ncbi:hypothetical protein Tam10B_0042 [Bifidobacterium vansinderenii]|uniref:Uncharacterized protein n=1 Tax=Bifidobacterium vansinderenii TaxID=1984871 RepID=A0A229W143_9BIFI|nr:hypothetical protein Tam10B_0042 [Bifidobacterium vansinderenii]
MLDAQISNPEAWRLIVNYFPESVRIFNIMIEETLG